jgi:hypothetical protein
MRRSPGLGIMKSEIRVRELAIRWYFLALYNEVVDGDQEKAACAFAAADAFIMVLDFPSAICSGKRSDEGLREYAKLLFKMWQLVSEDDKTLNVGNWLHKNVNVDFEHYI